MKKILALLLSLLMLLSLAACGEKKDETPETPTVKMGLLLVEGRAAEYNTHAPVVHGNGMAGIEHVYFDNLSAALLELKSGKIARMASEQSMVKYVIARNPELMAFGLDGERIIETSFSMMTMDTSKEVYDILNNAIKEIKADGTLDSLIENELTAYIETDPEPKDLPKFEGAQTIKIGITGDVPPMDFVTASGKAAGFNVALLTEIANRAKVNFELVQIETGARAIALSSGKVDAVFWTKGFSCTACDETWVEEIQGTLSTESYFTDSSAFIMLKPEE